LALVLDDTAVEHPHDPVRVAGDVVLVGDNDDRLTRFVELHQQLHDLVRGPRVEVPGGLVSEHDGRVVDQRPGHRHPLALAARELVGTMIPAVPEADALERIHRPLVTLAR